MGETTAISWTDHTFNPWWGCKRISPGCDHCYAATFAKRTGHDGLWSGTHRFFGSSHWAEPLKWNAQAERAGRAALVFCASMADVFEDHPELVVERAHLFELIERSPHLTWQLLTKRPENVLSLTPADWRWNWPSNAWIGATVEDQQRANERIPHLAKIPAAVRFLSCEPLLGSVDLTPWHITGPSDGTARAWIDWVIVGGESGPGHRPIDLDHARFLVAECEMAGIPVFFKQVGGRTPSAGGDQLDGRTIKQFPAGVAR